MGRANLKRGGLTQPQWELLCDLYRVERTISETYPPAKNLMAQGFIEKVPTGRFGRKTFRITPSGRKLVEAVRRAEKTG